MQQSGNLNPKKKWKYLIKKLNILILKFKVTRYFIFCTATKYINQAFCACIKTVENEFEMSVILCMDLHAIKITN